FHLPALEAPKTDDIAAGQEDQAAGDHQQGQPFEGSDQESKEASHSGKYAVRAEHAVDENLQQLDVDDDEADIHEQVQNRRERPLEHFFLTERDQQHGPQPLGRSITSAQGPAQPDITDNLSRIIRRQANGNDQQHHKG